MSVASKARAAARKAADNARKAARHAATAARANARHAATAQRKAARLSADAQRKAVRAETRQLKASGVRSLTPKKKTSKTLRPVRAKIRRA